MRLYTHPKLTIDIEETNGIKYFKEDWKGIINTVVFRDLIIKKTQLYEIEIPKLNNKTNVVFIFSDTSRLELLRKEDVEWLLQNNKTINENLGITHIALIPPLADRLNELVDTYSEFNKATKYYHKIIKSNKEGIDWFLKTIPS